MARIGGPCPPTESRCCEAIERRADHCRVAVFDPAAPSLHFRQLLSSPVVLAALPTRRAPPPVICLVGRLDRADRRSEANLRKRVLRNQRADGGKRRPDQGSPVTALLDFGRRRVSPTAAMLVDNLTGSVRMSALDFLREVGKTLPRQPDGVPRRRPGNAAGSAEAKKGSPTTEIQLPTAAGVGLPELYRTHGYYCRRGIGPMGQYHRGRGRSIGSRASRSTLATPLPTDAAGPSNGKSEGNAIWLSADMTSAPPSPVLPQCRCYVGALLRFFTDRSQPEIEARNAPHGRTFPNAAKALTGGHRDPGCTVILPGGGRGVEALFGAKQGI